MRSKARRLAWEVMRRLPERTLTARTRHGRLVFSSRDAAIGRRLYSHGEFEYATIEKAVTLARTEAPARVAAPWLVDVGANLGTVCIPLVRDREFARALAFEPEPRNYRYLVENVRANGLGGAITTVNAGLSSVNATMRLELAFDNFGDHRIRVSVPTSSHPECREADRAVIDVPVYRLDDALAARGIAPAEVGLLWIDVQGHEHHVLEGAGSLLASGVPVVAEFWPYALARAGTDAAAFAALIGSRFRWLYDLAEAAPARHAARDAAVLARYRDDTAFTDLLLVP